MVTVFQGWYIKVQRKGFLSKLWAVTFCDGKAVSLTSPYMLKEDAERFAQKTFEDVCRDYLERMKRERPDIFAEVLRDDNFIWKTEAMGNIPIGKIAKTLYQP
jgi:hypothetical protein